MIVIYGSSREKSNTEFLTEIGLEGKEVTRIHLREHTIFPIEDQRHEPTGFDRVDDSFDEVMQELMKHDEMVLATPIYWYGMSGLMKNFVDRWSQAMRDEKYEALREKIGQKKLYVVAVGGDNPRLKGLPLIQQFQYICDYFGMTFADYVIGKAGKPGDIEQDARAISDMKFMAQNWR
ncbi:flavodoxin family protein [Paenisporosarcina cavernae]|uniref:Flavodoxin family protein n=1 Tax=Paenisporosarcina cavernae TaxID=2320858 RepID=A0A385YT31_9BACL|nr:flavodoxin family protein [Paenisporosarcina cavernae]AYC28613.1 flavodoxin family protein [Paenisporosarcina cavernae]